MESNQIVCEKTGFKQEFDALELYGIIVNRYFYESFPGQHRYCATR